MRTVEQDSVRTALSNAYARLFDRQWPVWVGGILFGIANILLFTYEKPWSVAGGVRNWGDWFFNSINVSDKIIISPHLYSTSILNYGIIVGALAAALLAKQFQVRFAPGRELLKGLVGGMLMGIGAALAFGCNIGGFFSATSALSMAGVAMMIGLTIGALIGLKMLVWEITYLSPPSSKFQRTASTKNSVDRWRRAQPIAGIAVLLAGFALVFIYDGFDYSTRGGFLLFGLFIGIVMQRTRFCFVRAFREPFMTGNGEATRAVALAITISAIGFSILKWTDLRDWETFVSAGFWFGSLVGGLIFGIGMSLSGGCASGSLWRAGEGHVKLWVALIGFALATSYFGTWLEESGWIMKLGNPVFLPDVIGWKLGLITIIGIMCIWSLLTVWNEAKKKLVVV